jgi:hypothetical protein
MKPGHGAIRAQSIVDPSGLRLSDMMDAFANGVDWLARLFQQAGNPFALPMLPGRSPAHIVPALPRFVPVPMP